MSKYVIMLARLVTVLVVSVVCGCTAAAAMALGSPGLGAIILASTLVLIFDIVRTAMGE